MPQLIRALTCRTILTGVGDQAAPSSEGASMRPHPLSGGARGSQRDNIASTRVA